MRDGVSAESVSDRVSTRSIIETAEKLIRSLPLSVLTSVRQGVCALVLARICDYIYLTPEVVHVAASCEL